MEKCRHLENCRRLSIVFILMPCLVSPFQTQGSPSLDCKCPFLPSSRFTTVHDQLPVLSIGVCCRVSARHSAGLHAATWFARFACWFLPCDLRTQHSLSDTQQEAFISRPCAPGAQAGGRLGSRRRRGSHRGGSARGPARPTRASHSLLVSRLLPPLAEGVTRPGEPTVQGRAECPATVQLRRSCRCLMGLCGREGWGPTIQSTATVGGWYVFTVPCCACIRVSCSF